MKQNIIHIGLDVDDTQYHGSAFNKDTGEVIDFKSQPTLKGLLQQLMLQRQTTGLNTIPWPKKLDHYKICSQSDRRTSWIDLVFPKPSFKSAPTQNDRP